jgi:chromate transporter
MWNRKRSGPLAELLRLFLRLGLTAFGGPAAHLARMQSEAVERRGWISREGFLDLVGVCNLLPGPGSTQVAMALGFVRAGWLGLLVAGTCFILPAALSTLALAWLYCHFGGLGVAHHLLYGVKPVMLAILLHATGNLGRTGLRTWKLAALAVLALTAALLGLPPLGVLLACGGGCLAAVWLSRRPTGASQAGGLAMLATGLSPAKAGLAVSPALLGLLPVALVFLKLGLSVFGSGYVLLAFLQTELVDRLHWITSAQLLDSLAAGQLTPGPVFATATFLGYLLQGLPGAVVATVAIFLPSFLLAALAGTVAGRLRNRPLAAAFLDGVNAAAVALMASVAWPLGSAALVDPATALLALASAAMLFRTKINPTWLLLAAAFLGLLLGS